VSRDRILGVRSDQLPDVELARVISFWAARLGAPADAFRRPGLTFVPATASAADEVVLVSLGPGAVILAPPRVREAVPGPDESDGPTTPDAAAIVERLQHLGSRLVAEATLLYLPAGRFRPHSGPTRRATATDVASILERCSPADVAEASVQDPDEVVVSLTGDGDPAALAQLETWDDEVGQLSILTASDRRRHGHAAVAASALVGGTLARGLLPQWRVRVGHLASENLARRLGFVPAGRQALIALAARP